MKMKNIVLLIFMLTSFTISAQQSKFGDVYAFLDNTVLFEINQAEVHPVGIFWKSIEKALSLHKLKSENVLSLNGKRKFHFANTL